MNLELEFEGSLEGHDDIRLVGAAPDTAEAHQDSSSQVLGGITGVIVREEKRRKLLVWSVAAFCLTVAFVIARVSDARTSSTQSGSLEWLLPVGAAFALFLPILAALIAAFPRRKLRDSMKELARHGTVNTVDAIIGARRSLIGPKTSRALREALALALKDIRASDRDRVSRSSYAEILRLLGVIASGGANRRHVELYEAVICAMEQIGDERALPAMERIADMSVRTAAEKRLKQAALACLPALRERARDSMAAGSLLRAVVPDPTTELLLPVSGPCEPGRDLLLRHGQNPVG